MECSVCEDYAQQCDPQQPKTRKPRPKKEVAKKPDPKKIFEGAPKTPSEPKPAKQKPGKRHSPSLSVRSEGPPREGRRGDGHNTAQSHWSGTRVAFTPRHTHHTRNHLIVELHLGTLHSLAGEQGVI